MKRYMKICLKSIITSLFLGVLISSPAISGESGAQKNSKISKTKKKKLTKKEALLLKKRKGESPFIKS